MAKKTANSAEGSAEGGRGEITKTEAVKRVLDQLGKDTKPVDICNQVKEQFGLDLSTAHASNIKSTLTSEKGKSGRKKYKKRGRKAKAQAEPKMVAKAANGRSKGKLNIQDIEILKGLADRINAKELHALIDVLKT